MIHKNVFTARNLTSNAGLFLLLENAKANGIFILINTVLVFDRPSTDKIKMKHIKTLLCSHYIGIDRLERIKLLLGNLVDAFEISEKVPETVSRFLGNFNYKPTQIMLEECCTKGIQFPGLQIVVEKEKTKIYYH